MATRHENQVRGPQGGEALAIEPGWLLAVGFLVLAAVLWFTSAGTALPSAPTAEVDAASLDVGSRRAVLTDPPTVVIAGFDQRCNACHKLFQSNWNGTRPLTQHQHISLVHGINNECDNCHAKDDREQLVLHDGSTVGFARTEVLCAQCHGPVFRDWERGTHGKTMGAWDPASPHARRLSCTECHDPHAPMYDAMAPLPGPNTLRMGTPKADVGHHHDERNPLRRWAQPSAHGDDD